MLLKVLLSLILFSLLLVSSLVGVGSDLFVVLLEGSQVFTSLGELSLFHSFSDVPVDEGTLCVHEIEFVVQTGPGLSDGGGVGEHAHGTWDLGEISSWNHSWWLVVDSNLESGWAPVNELDGSLGLDGGDGGVNVLWNDVSSVQEADSHVLSVAWITLYHLVGWLEAAVGDVIDGKSLMISLKRESGQWEVDSWVWDQVGLELVEINIESSIETKRGSDRRDNLGDDTVQVGVAWTINAEVSTADIVDGFVVNHEGTVGVLKGGMGGKNRVVWLNNSGRNLWSWVDGELQLGFLSVVDRKTLHEKRESLESAAVISKTADSVENGVDQFLSDGVVTTSIIVGGVFLSGDHLLWVEKLLVGSRANLVCKSSFLNRARPHVIDINLPTTVGSRSTKIERGTYLPFPVSEKKVVKDSPSACWSDGMVPSGWIPCSRQ
ncbi:hypothetical protein GCK72_000628 [Caenorhabditis remanei]|uniref:Uncharacterized protein n=1 Tax=Caenorhabditis remanei TaxID=31234 RepID=A0A6A5HMK8_CAERE|nr:hypothetical protein GCK72_000628 [Caenorhabditis remanei]KAF1768815.1 hypothetical protein GCK72_000628 [Caenorhabditis remanei]